MRLSCIVFAGSFLVSTPLAGQSAADLLAEGRTHIASGRLADALAAFRAAIRIDSVNVGAWRGVGASLHRMEQYPEALDALNRAAAISPRDHAVRFNRGLTLSELGRIREAVAELDTAVILRPDFAPAWTERGAANTLIGRLTDARADWQHAIELDSTYIWSRYYRGLAGIIEGDYRGAVADLDAVTDKQGLLGAHLWRWAAHLLDGRPAPTLPAHANDWPGPVAGFLKGELSETTLIATAREARSSLDDRRLATAYFFVGVKHLAEGRRSQARAALRSALELRAPRHADYVAAEALLRRIPGDR